MSRIDDLAALTLTYLARLMVAVDAKMRPRAYETAHERRQREAREARRRRDADRPRGEP